MLFFIIILITTFLLARHWATRTATACCQKISMSYDAYCHQAYQKDATRCPHPSCDSIEALLDYRFCGEYIEHYRVEEISSFFRVPYREAVKSEHMNRIFCLKDRTFITTFVQQYQHLEEYISNHNKEYINKCLEENAGFFDHVLKYPLDHQQRQAIVTEETNCLVVSSAGSGKTSSIIGKVEYLVRIRKTDPSKILLISYTNKAAAELTERMQIPGMKGYTFHKLALDCIAQAEQNKPNICENTDRIFADIYQDLAGDDDYKQKLIEYLVCYQIEESDMEKKAREKKEDLKAAKQNGYKSLLPDMDGKSVWVRSRQEQTICFILGSLSVDFRYEEPYEFIVSDENHSQYKPDFSIHFSRNGHPQRIYLEHFGIDRMNRVPRWFAEEKGISYEEANKKYNDGITWKRAVHHKHNTILLETTSADFSYNGIRRKIKELLQKAGVPFREIPEKDIYRLLMPQGSQQEKAIIRLFATFVTLMKTNCRSMDDILRYAETQRDERSIFIITELISPIYRRYVQYLNQNRQKDFTDLILEATEVYKREQPWHFDYIIVDEFQDISIDRYLFLLALRAGNPPAKLFCVGDDWQSIYRFSGSDMTLFNSFEEYFGYTDVHKIETTYRFGNPLVTASSRFIQKNPIQIRKNIKPFNAETNTALSFVGYGKKEYVTILERILADIPQDKSIFLLGRYSFDDYYLSYKYKGYRKGNKYFYRIGDREIEFLTIHKSKGLEADYVIIMQCNKDIFGFPSYINDDPVLNLVLCKDDPFPFGEERRLFYVAITRAKVKTLVLYDLHSPSVFVEEFIHPDKSDSCSSLYRNANKHWSINEDKFLVQLYREGKSIRYISQKMGRSQTAILMRLKKQGEYKAAE